MGLFKAIFGGTDKSAQKGQKADNAASRKFIEEQMAAGRADVMGAYPAAEANRNMGYQSALDVYGQTMPQELSTYQQGNMNAQGTLLAGMPQMMNAIYGLPTDMSGLTPQAVQYDPSYTQQQLPDYAGIQGPAGAEQPQQQQQQQQPGMAQPGQYGGTGFNLNDLLAGYQQRNIMP
jgi:hypothetical protein